MPYSYVRVVAVCLGKEFDVRAFEELFPGKVFVRWEEPVLLDVHGMEAYVFAFGTVVFFGYDETTAKPLLERLKNIVEDPVDPFYEEYEWKENEWSGKPILLESPVWVTDEAIYGKLGSTGKKILAYVLAQSASLRRVEAASDDLLERMESLLDQLLSSPFIISLKGVRRSLIEALKIRGSLLNDLLILEKPASAWEEEGYERLFERLRYVFEIGERYNVVSKKLSSVVETAQMVSQLINDGRFLILEALIVLFFLVEIILGLI